MLAAGDVYYLVTSLPTMAAFGEPLPLSMSEMLDVVEESASVREILETIYLIDDLQQYQAYQVEEISETVPTVLSKEQLEGHEPLPDYLVVEEESHSPLHPAEDRFWTSYFQYAARQAQQLNSFFMGEWTAFEVGLRNALAEARANTLGLDAQDYRVCPELGADFLDVRELLSQWSGAENPLAAQRVVDRFRWQWLDEHDAWFTFKNDEIIVYGVRLMLLERWRRIGEEPQASRQSNE